MSKSRSPIYDETLMKSLNNLFLVLDSGKRISLAGRLVESGKN